MQVMVAMSGGVDSSVAAAMMLDAGHEVVGVTMKLWGGPSDKGCCSVSDVLDARRAADAIGVDHHVFNFGDDFERHVIAPYVTEHDAGRTPNPCIECNRSIKFARLLERADALGFDAVVTGHHAQIVTVGDGTRRIARAVDVAKDQSYVLHMIPPKDLARVEFPIGGLEKSVVRQMAADMGMRVANKPDSQDVCFISSTTSRDEFLGDRLTHTPAEVVDTDGNQVGQVDSIQLVTIGQRKGLGLAGGSPAQYVNNVDIGAQRVTIGTRQDLLSESVELDVLTWVGEPVSQGLVAQTSAHGATRPARVHANTVTWETPQQRVAPGQTVVLYDGDIVVGGGVAR
ncbi:MAG: tRNA 2-thiouridine(34) synthase MnmA [Acidimicrobiales bacterium]|jgi:tRNA-specific 2-thiouridylase